MNFLLSFVIIPVLMVLALFLTNNRKQVLSVMVAGSAALVVATVYLVWAYLSARSNGADAPMLFTSSWMWYKALNIGFSLGVDGVSVSMLALSTLIVLTGTLVSWRIEPLTKEYFLWFSLLSTGVFGFFISTDMFTMFMFYEVALIPMYLLIGIWGSGPKEYSAMKLTLMLMGASAFLLVGILGIYFSSGAASMNILDIVNTHIPMEKQRLMFVLTFFGFGVLGAMFPFHTWSPDGHAAAPTAVSMLHAGVLMKLGGYGAYRISVYLLPEAAKELAPIFLVLTAIGVVYGALTAIHQRDLKYINAYSSVSHCNLVLFAILMLTQTALTGAVLQMLSHGFMTALFFALIGMIYERTGTRMITEMGGLMKVIPFLGVAFVIGGLASLGLPGLSGFAAEMTIFFGAFENADLFRRVLTIVSITAIVSTAVYILRMVGKFLYGPMHNPDHAKISGSVWYEQVAVVILIAGIVYIGSFPLGLSEMIHESLADVMAQLSR